MNCNCARMNCGVPPHELPLRGMNCACGALKTKAELFGLRFGLFVC